MRNSFLSAVATASVALLAVGSVPAAAQDYNGGYYQNNPQVNPYAQQQQQYDNQGYAYQRNENYQRPRSYRGRRHGYRHSANGNYSYNNGSGGNYYRGQSYAQTYCHQRSGTTGTIAGAVGGGLLGNVIARGTAGTLIGAGAGALLGRNIERHGMGEKC
ncbi:MAG: hypothetical protein NVS3B5_21210 [Sphingomicrobium sp.]